MPVESANKPASTPPEKGDRYRAEMPQIPGVYKGVPGAHASANNASTTRLVQIGGLTAAAILIGLVFLWRTKIARHNGPESSASETTEILAPPSTETPFEAPAPNGPTVAATSTELAKPWSAKQFTFVKPLTHENVDAMLVRLPGGKLWAFAVREPYGRCDLEFVTDLGRLAKQYGYRASHPMVASPCSNAVYDPLKVGTVGGSIFVRGEIVHGEGLRPPNSIDVNEKGGSISANRME